jgi:ADP-dependent phosphofructokinase/glucokinase
MSRPLDLGDDPAPADWQRAYAALARHLPETAGRARLTLCGLSTCVDAYIRLEEAHALLSAAPGTPEGAFAARILDRARRGVGGEIHVDWPDGPRWLEACLPITLGLGGTGAQAAQMLATLGAPTLVAIGDRTARQVERFHPNVGLAGPGGPTTMGAIRGTPGMGKPAHYIVEFQAGSSIGGHVLPRSSRIICRFADDPLENDPAFEAASLRQAGQAGAAILSGYNEVPAGLMASSLEHSRSLARGWREAGLGLVHLELGDFHDMGEAWPVMEGLAGPVNSLGLSLSELDNLLPGADPVERRAAILAERLGMERVAVHYDTFALAVTRHDPARELEALMTGSLLASTRARHGRVTVPDGVPEGAVFERARLPPQSRTGTWNVATCATPWLKFPAATIGLGDTFLAGTLLVLGQP